VPTSAPHQIINLRLKMNPQEHVPLIVNGTPVSLPDRSPIGRQILDAAHLRPIDDFVLLQLLPDGALEEISSDESVSLNHDAVTEFFALKTDRIFYFLMDGRKFPWEENIPEEILQKLSNTSASVDIWLQLEDVADRKIEPGEVVNLSGTGVEKFYSKARITHQGPFTVFFNGRPRTIAEHQLDYAQVIRIAFPEGPFGATTIYTVTYVYPHGGSEGSMVDGDTVKIKEGMVFNVSRTDQS
jgi:hypothetical protein